MRNMERLSGATKILVELDAMRHGRSVDGMGTKNLNACEACTEKRLPCLRSGLGDALHCLPCQVYEVACSLKASAAAQDRREDKHTALTCEDPGSASSPASSTTLPLEVYDLIWDCIELVRRHNGDVGEVDAQVGEAVPENMEERGSSGPSAILDDLIVALAQATFRNGASTSHVVQRYLDVFNEVRKVKTPPA
ncbi:hypothetical protein ONZ45_g17858 [Pleurotus djamor]|nr:hypothetical protein ONZ45_g17858 [Pleurotus djamor]